MDDLAATEKLAEALPHDRGCLWIRSDIDAPCTCLTARRQAAVALLPVVREIAADELRGAAEESTYWVLTREMVYTRLNEHADELTKP